MSMQYSAATARKTRNPHQWAYQKMLSGKHVNTLHLMDMFRRYHEEERRIMLHAFCEAAGKIAIHSQLLTKRQRLKYGTCRMALGRETYYFFDRHMCPADVGARIDLTSGEVVYR